jgi:hypothetical protein
MGLGILLGDRDRPRSWFDLIRAENMQDDGTDEIIAILYDFDSQENQLPCLRGGSRPGKMGNLERRFADAHDRLCLDYFTSNRSYNDRAFRRRFRSWTES